MNRPDLTKHIPMNWPPLVNSADALAYARAIACLCAVGCSHDLAMFPPLIKSMRQYTTQPIDFDVDCQPHRLAITKTGDPVWFMPSWARHGVRYLRPHVDLYSLSPEVWVMDFMATVERVILDLTPNMRALFEMAERSMQFDLDERRSSLDNQSLLVDSQKIKRLGIRA